MRDPDALGDAVERWKRMPRKKGGVGGTDLAMGHNPGNPSEPLIQSPVKWAVHPPQNGTIGFDPQPSHSLSLWTYFWAMPEQPAQGAGLHTFFGEDHLSGK